MVHDIYLSTLDRSQMIVLPVPPQEFFIKSPWKNETTESISIGELKLIGLKGLQSISLNSFFPSKNYPFRRDGNVYTGMEYITIIENWRATRQPLRFIIPTINANMPMTIDELEYGFKDGTGDVYYNMTINEYKVI